MIRRFLNDVTHTNKQWRQAVYAVMLYVGVSAVVLILAVAIIYLVGC